jgi:hypothetical protein
MHFGPLVGVDALVGFQIFQKQLCESFQCFPWLKNQLAAVSRQWPVAVLVELAFF